MSTANLLAASETTETLYAAALWLLRAERLTDAIHLFRVMLLAAPSDERGWLGLATAHERLEQDDIALKLYEAAKRTSRAPRCAIARARLLRKLGRDDEADHAFDEAEDQAANDDEALALLAAVRRAA